ncbi:MAG: hypothetical protein KDA60_05930 [Planctomycetales bacterium]|nr:hypothetical protein [Planctomycetales bacterium]
MSQVMESRTRGTPRPTTSRPKKIVCYLRPGEYANRFERGLTRNDIAVMRAQNEMHALWMVVSTQPDAIVTDISITELETNYLISRLAENDKTAKIPVIVLGTGARRLRELGIRLAKSVRIVEVTTPTRMAEDVLSSIDHICANRPDIAKSSEPQVHSYVAVDEPHRQGHGKTADDFRKAHAISDPWDDSKLKRPVRRKMPPAAAAAHAHATGGTPNVDSPILHASHVDAVHSPPPPQQLQQPRRRLS